jgi:methionyl-tRNA formyltransferase
LSSSLEDKALKICRVRLGDGHGAPGTVLRADKSELEVACGSGSLFIEELQLEGRKRLTTQEFLTGVKIAPGTLLGRKETPRG